RGVASPDDPGFYYTTVTNPDGTSPTVSSVSRFAIPQPISSWFSPSVAQMPGGGLAACWKGPGDPVNGGDDNLYFSTAAGLPDPGWAPVPGPIQVPVPGGAMTPHTVNRPTLALMTTTSQDTLVLVYTVYPGTSLAYLVAPVSAGVPGWSGGSANNGACPAVLPLDTLLSAAGPGGGPVTLQNPVAVWAAAAATGDPLYLLVGDQPGSPPGGNITGPLYLLSYSGE
ncbi:MAG TPA: hypothetical protein VFS20_33155, partial [Longimicrobium sp.]|nr:hypothetical protein [Longimicrobium sp.]